MAPVKRLIREIHRRSLWQVLTIYLVGSFGALQVVEGVTNNAGLPDWVPPFALILLIIGLPIVAATAFIQEGLPGRTERSDKPADESAATKSTGLETSSGPATPPAAPPVNLAAGTGALDRPSTRPPLYKRVMTWRHAMVGGGLAFALLGVAVAGYFAMRVTGIGPVASLQAQGLFDDRETIVLADFRNVTSDPTLGAMVTEALRVDLVQSPVLRVLDPTDVAVTLRRMERPTDVPLSADDAREVAAREGMKAALAGEIGPLGSGYVVTATLVGALDGRTLAAFRVTAEGEDDLIRAVDKLSQDIREKSGESLHSIKAGPPLEQVTTASPEALRKYTSARQIFMRGADDERALQLMEEAVALDTGFAAAWRGIAVILSNARADQARMIEAATRAFEHGNRLTELERYQAAALYHLRVTGDPDEAIRAYESLLAIDPDDLAARNNTGVLFIQQDRYEEAEVQFRAIVQSGNSSSTSHSNLAFALVMQDKLDDARAVLADFVVQYPDDPAVFGALARVERRAGNWAQVDANAGQLIDPSNEVADQTAGHALLWSTDALRGRLTAGRPHLAEYVRMREAANGSAGALEARLEDLVGRVRTGLDVPDARAVQALLDESAWVNIDPLARPFQQAATAFAQTGARERVEAVLEEWEAEVPANLRGVTYDARRSTVLAVLALAEGDATAAAQGIEEGRRGQRCTRCWRSDLAAAYVASERIDEAIATYRSIVEEPQPSARGDAYEHPFALERLGQLYDAQGNVENAITYYSRFADLWQDADPELQPRVQRASERVAQLIAARG